MTAVFNAPESADRSAANEGRTSDALQFDLKTLYSDLGATTRGGSSGNREAGTQIDFGIGENLYTRASDSQSSSPGGFSVEEQGAMDIARRFASFNDDTRDNTSNISFDREDAGRLVEVYGDMYNAQNSLQEGDKSEAGDWLGEMRKDLASFTKGLFGDTDEGTGQENGHEDSSEHHTNNSCPEDSGSEGKGGEDEGAEEGTDEGFEEGSEEPCEPGDAHLDSGAEGYTPEDSMVLLMNDMQQLSEALASGDSEAVQQIMARMNRHLALMMRQLNGQEGEGESDGEGTAQEPQPMDDNWFERGPGGRRGPISGRTDLFNPLDPIHGLPNPGDILGSLPTPGDILGGLPNPGDILGRLPQPPNPSDILGRLPQPPNPQDLLRNLPQPPNPQDLLRNLPQPPNPGDLLRNLPSPADLFDIF